MSARSRADGHGLAAAVTLAGLIAAGVVIAATAPTALDDAGDGYAIGSRWIDTSADATYTCTDAAIGAAVWVREDGAGGGGALVVRDEGATVLASATILDFVGAGVVATDGGSGRAVITIAGGGGGAAANGYFPGGWG